MGSAVEAIPDLAATRAPQGSIPGGQVSNCGSMSVISCQGALEPTKTCTVGRAPGSPSTVASGTSVTAPSAVPASGERVPPMSQACRWKTLLMIFHSPCTFSRVNRSVKRCPVQSSSSNRTQATVPETSMPAMRASRPVAGPF